MMWFLFIGQESPSSLRTTQMQLFSRQIKEKKHIFNVVLKERLGFAHP